jgi:hypothetical protein
MVPSVIWSRIASHMSVLSEHDHEHGVVAKGSVCDPLYALSGVGIAQWYNAGVRAG